MYNKYKLIYVSRLKTKKEEELKARNITNETNQTLDQRHGKNKQAQRLRRQTTKTATWTSSSTNGKGSYWGISSRSTSVHKLSRNGDTTPHQWGRLHCLDKKSRGKNSLLGRASSGRLKILMEMDRRSKNEDGRSSKHQTEYATQSSQKING